MSQYAFSAEPRAAPNRRQLYRAAGPEDSDSSGMSNNIMYDRRVVRGNTNMGVAAGGGGAKGGMGGGGRHGGGVNPAAPGGENMHPGGSPVPAKFRRKIPAHKRTVFDLRPEVRRHIEVDLDAHLVEVAAPTICNAESTQTARFMFRPPTPEYQPAKTGVRFIVPSSPPILVCNPLLCLRHRTHPHTKNTCVHTSLPQPLLFVPHARRKCVGGAPGRCVFPRSCLPCRGPPHLCSHLCSALR